MNDANRSFESNKECSNPFQSAQKHRLQNPKNIATGHLLVNSLRNKFEAVEEIVQNKVDICFLSETKINETFPNQQFRINGYKLFHRDRYCHGGGILCYNNGNISSKTVNFPLKLANSYVLVSTNHLYKLRTIFLIIYLF